MLLEVQRSPSIFFRGMEGSRIPVATAHGEGYAEFRDDAQRIAAEPLVALRFADNRGAPTEAYPCNANGSPDGVTGTYHRGRTLYDPDAASGARLSLGADVVAASRMGRGFAVDADVPQCARVAAMTTGALQ